MKKIKGDVEWFLPKQKRPFAYSTISSSDLIEVLAEEGRTVEEVWASINFDADAKAILAHYMAKGFSKHNLKKLLNGEVRI